MLAVSSIAADSAGAEGSSGLGGSASLTDGSTTRGGGLRYSFSLFFSRILCFFCAFFSSKSMLRLSSSSSLSSNTSPTCFFGAGVKIVHSGSLGFYIIGCFSGDRSGCSILISSRSLVFLPGGVSSLVSLVRLGLKKLTSVLAIIFLSKPVLFIADLILLY